MSVTLQVARRRRARGDRPGRGFSTEHIAKVGAYMQFDRKMQEQQGLGSGWSSPGA